MGIMHTPKVAILASGSGTTAEAFIHATQEGIIDVEVALIVSDKEDAGILERIAELNKRYNLNIQTRVINGKLYPKGKQLRGQSLQESEEICRVIRKAGCSLVVLMGYMRIIAAQGALMQEYGWLQKYASADPLYDGIYFARMLNTHHGILPETAGHFGIGIDRQVLRLGLTETAHTVHVVGEEVDTGPIFQVNHVPVYPHQDTPEQLFARVQRVEKAHLPIDVDRFIREQREFQLAV